MCQSAHHLFGVASPVSVGRICLLLSFLFCVRVLGHGADFSFLLAVGPGGAFLCSPLSLCSPGLGLLRRRLFLNSCRLVTYGYTHYIHNPGPLLSSPSFRFPFVSF